MSGVVLKDPIVSLHAGALVIDHGEADDELITTETDHGLEVGDAVIITGLEGGTGLTADTIYYVKTTPGSDTLTLSEEPDGATAEFSADITAGTIARVIDLSGWVHVVNLGRPSDTIDARVFAHPSATRKGGGMDACTLSVRWSPAFRKLLAPVAYELGRLFFTPRDGGKTFSFDTRLAKVPIGRLQPGAIVDSELPIAVLSDVDWEA